MAIGRRLSISVVVSSVGYDFEPPPWLDPKSRKLYISCRRKHLESPMSPMVSMPVPCTDLWSNSTMVTQRLRPANVQLLVSHLHSTLQLCSLSEAASQVELHVLLSHSSCIESAGGVYNGQRPCRARCNLVFENAECGPQSRSHLADGGDG